MMRGLRPLDIDALINQITSLQIGLDAIEQSIERSGDPGGALKLVRDALREMIKALKSLLEQGPEGQNCQAQAENGDAAHGADPADSTPGPGVEVVIGSIGHLIGGIIGGIIAAAPKEDGNPGAAEEFPGKWVDGSHYRVDGECYRVEWLAIDGMIKARVRPVPCSELE